MIDDRAFALGQLDRLQGFYPRVEGKASFLFALNIGLGGILAANVPATLASPPGIFAVVAALLIGFSLFNLSSAFFPHLAPAPRSSVLYFGDVAALSAGAFMTQVKGLSDADLLDDIHCQIWRNSEILAIKFRRTEVAFRFTAVALVPWFLFLTATAALTGEVPNFVVGP